MKFTTILVFGLLFWVGSLRAQCPPGAAIVTQSLPAAQQQQPYAQTIVVNGLANPSFEVFDGTELPAGLSLNPLTGELSGTPGGFGQFFFSVKVTDGPCTLQQNYLLSVTRVVAYDTLQTNLEENVPTPMAALARSGFSVAVWGDHALVGAPTALSGQGMVFVFARNGNAWTQQAQLLAADGAAYDNFGQSVAFSGNYALIGAPYDDLGALQNAGSAYVFVRNGGAWTQQAKLTASDAAANDNFGFSASISGAYALVGATNGDGAVANQGSAYVFRAQGGGAWAQEAELLAADGAASDFFGWAVSIYGNYALIGASSDDHPGMANSGSAYVFFRNGAAWAQQAKLVAADAAANDNFGNSVKLFGNRALIGAVLDDIGANVDQGSAYVFEANGAVWSQTTKLTAADGTGGARFGTSVAAYGDMIAVGARAALDAAAIAQGAVYVYAFSGAAWTPLQKITREIGTANDFFGDAVALHGGHLVVGAPQDQVNALNNAGSFAVYRLTGCRGTQFVTALPLGIKGSPYTSVLVAAGPDPFTFGLVQGITLPQGMTLDAQSGTITGTPNAAGSYSLKFSAQNAVCYMERSLTLDIWPKSILSDWQESEQRLFDPELFYGGVEYGSALSMTPDYAIVGAKRWGWWGEGKTLIYRRTGDHWQLDNQIYGTNNKILSGAAVATNETYLAITRQETLANTTGEIVIYKRQGSDWNLDTLLLPPNPYFQQNMEFGKSLAISGDKLIVGAPKYDYAGVVDAGVAFVYQLNGNNWVHSTTLLPTYPSTGAAFGSSVTLRDSTFFVGAPRDNNTEGSVHIYNGAQLVKQVSASDGAANDRFGTSIAVEGNVLLVGAPEDDDPFIGFGLGSIYVFRLGLGNNWVQEAKLTATGGANNHRLGTSVAIKGGLAFGGAPGANSAVLFARNGNAWSQMARIQPGNIQSNDQFGAMVAIEGDLLIMGGPIDSFRVGWPANDTAQYLPFGSVGVFKLSDCTNKTVQTLSLPDATLFTAYQQPIATSGFVAPVYSLAIDRLPPGLALDSLSGMIQGRPTASGSFTFSVRVKDADCYKLQAYTLSVGQGTGTLASGDSLTKWTANDGASNDNFGRSVAIADSIAIVGAPLENNGQGSVYLFRKTANGWVQSQKVSGVMQYGCSVDTNGEYAIVGSDGSAFIYRITPNGLILVSSLSPPPGITSNAFGKKVAISGEQVIVSDEGGGMLLQGSVHLYAKNGNTWTYRQSMSERGYNYPTYSAHAIAISEELIAVGNHGYNINQMSSAGSVSLYRKTGNVWQLAGYHLTPDDPIANGNFGKAVAISGNYLFVGSPKAQGIDGWESNNAGAVYIYYYTGPYWVFQQKLYDYEYQAGDGFGSMLSASGDNLIVATNGASGQGTERGGVILFTRTGNTWSEKGRFLPTGAGSEHLGASLSIWGDNLLLGAPTEAIAGQTGQGSAYFSSLKDCSGKVILDSILPAGVQMQPYAHTVQVTGFVNPVFTASRQVPGLSLDPASGQLSGQPTGQGPFPLALTVSESGCSIKRSFWVNIQKDSSLSSFILDQPISTTPLNSLFVAAVRGNDFCTSRNTGIHFYHREPNGWAYINNTLGASAFSIMIDGDQAIAGYAHVNSNRGAMRTCARAGGTWVTSNFINPIGNIPVNSFFGQAVDMEGDFAFIGAPYREIFFGPIGALYVFKKTNNTWIPWQRFSDYGGGLGHSVSVCNDTMLVGAPQQANNQGGVRVYVRNGELWELQATLIAPDRPLGTLFGYSVSLSAGRAVIGAFGDQGYQGAVYIFRHLNGAWVFETKLAPPFPEATEFGRTVSLSGNCLTVGSPSTSFYGNHTEGAIYLFEYNGANWVYNQTIRPTYESLTRRFSGGNISGGRMAVTNLEVYRFADCSQTNIQTQSLSPATQMAPYSQQITATGFTNLVFRLVEGSCLPAGLTLDAATGLISGTPTGFGLFHVAVQAHGGCERVQHYLLEVQRNPSLTDWPEGPSSPVANDGAAGDQFGSAVSVHGNLAIVGAPFDDIGASTDLGSAYIFRKNGALWQQEAKISPYATQAGSRFGTSVAICGRFAVVGAPLEDIPGAVDAGVVYAYWKDDNGFWRLIQNVQAGDYAANDRFGSSVSLFQDFVVVGAPGDDLGAAADAGSAYVFWRRLQSWTEMAKLTAADAGAGDRFGSSVSGLGERVLVGAPGDNLGNGAEQGSAYVFTRSGYDWAQQAKLTAPSGTPGDRFGEAVAISIDVAAVGAPIAQVGANSAQGSVEIFARNGANWAHETQITAPDGSANDRFGASLALDGGFLAVGAPLDTSGGAAIGGSAYVFARNGANGWTDTAKVFPAAQGQDVRFGSGVALHGDLLFAGAPLHDVAANADQGRAYFYLLSPACVSDTLPPVFLQVPDITVTAPLGSCSATVSYAVQALELCSTPMILSYSIPNGSLFSLGTDTVYVTATDALGNAALDTFTVTVQQANGAGFTVQVASTPTCYGANIGSLSAMGGNGAQAPFSYVWSNGTTNASLAALPFGSYAVTATDANGCTGTGQGSVGVSPGMQLSLSQLPTCPGGAFGSASVDSISGGIPPYAYAWSNGATAAQVLGVQGGAYQVSVSDANGCTTSAYVGVAFLPGMVLQTSSSPTCAGGLFGSVALNGIGGGTPPYAYVWSNGATTTIQSGLSIGTYGLTVTDALGCTASSSPSVTASPAVTVSATAVSPACPGAAIGSAVAVAGGGQAPIAYLWSNGADSAAVVGLPEGPHSVTATDALGCSAADTISVALLSSMSLTLAADPACAGAPTGSAALLAPPGGTPPLAYLWSNGATTAALVGLAPGDYTLLVTDADGCTVSDTATVAVAQVLLLAPTALPSCLGGETGSASAAALSGGVSPYTFVWTDGSTAAALSGLAPGAYGITATDANGCTISDTAMVTVTQILSLTPSSSPSCPGGATGSASAALLGGAPPYAYAWSNGSTADVLAGLGAGAYSVTVADANGCSISGTAAVGLAPATPLSATATAACGPTGTATVSVGPGGVPPFFYLWSDGQSGATATGLVPGTYSVTTTDAAGCTASAAAQVAQQAPQATALAVAPACPGVANGTVALLALSGVPPFLYDWGNGTGTVQAVGDTLLVPGLSAGPFAVTVTDAGGCTASVQATVLALPPALSVAPTPSCAGAANGAAQASVANAAPGQYAFDWSGGQTGTTVAGLAPGQYSVTAAAANGCSASASFAVGSVALSLSATAVPACNGVLNGQVGLTVAGDAPPFFFQWSNGALTEDLLNVGQGGYAVLVTDVFGCTATATATVGTGFATVAASGATVVCPGASAILTASSPFAGTNFYTWSYNGVTSPTVIVPSPGIYTVTLTTQNNCTATASIEVVGQAICTNLAPLAASDSFALFQNGLPISGNLLANDSDPEAGQLSLSLLPVQGPAHGTVWLDGDGSFSYLPDPGYLGTDSLVYQVCDNGAPSACALGVARFTVTPCSVFVLSLATGSCGLNGTASAIAGGGQPPYAYVWSNGTGGQTLSGLTPGTYAVTATDVAGCTASSAAVSNYVQNLSISVSATPPSCVTDLSVLTASGGQAYAWSNGAQGASISVTEPGTYTVTASAGGCTASASHLFVPYMGLSVVETPDCAAGAVAVVATASGTATGPYTYVWSNGAAGPSVSLPAGAHSVTATDITGCQRDLSLSLSVAAAFSVSVTQTVPDLCGQGNGALAAALTGQAALPVQYAWSGAQTGAAVSGLPAGAYGVTATDALGCTASAMGQVAAQQSFQLSLSVQPTSCGLNSGAAQAQPLGQPVAPVVYIWSNGAAGPLATMLGAGPVSITATDALGCTASAASNVSSLAPLGLSVSALPAVCGQGGGSAVATATGAAGSVTFVWSNGQTGATATGLSPGVYAVTATDGGGCPQVGAAWISAANPFALQVQKTPAWCGSPSGTATATAIGNPNGGSVSIVWSNGQVGPNATGLSLGTYAVAATDAAGCAQSLTVQVQSAPSIVQALLSAQDSRCGQPNGSVSVVAVYGTPVGPLSYLWSNGQTNATATGLLPGNYTVTVSDAHCFVTAARNVGDLNWVSPLIASSFVPCANPNGGAATVSLPPFVPTPVYAWSNGQTGVTATGLPVGWYSVTVSGGTCFGHGNVHVQRDPACNVRVTGRVVDDTPLQACVPGAQQGVPNKLLRCTGPAGYLAYRYSAPGGGYLFVGPEPGVYTVELLNTWVPFELPYLPLCGAVRTATLANYGDVSAGNDFYLVLNDTIRNLLTVVQSDGTPRPGEPRNYSVRTRNLGGSPATGQTALTWDPILGGFVPYSPPTVLDPVNRTVAWNFANLVPGAWTFGQGQLTVGIGTPIGTPMQSVGASTPVVGDHWPLNNYFVYNQSVSNSYDPNDKNPNLGREISVDDSLVIYTIRFQNTGTDTAYTVVVRDTLDNGVFEVGTLTPLASSHPYRLERDGDALAFFFEDIFLVDSFTNALGSQGFVQFAVRLREDLEPGDLVQNRAAIYFDFNEPIITNTAINEVVTGLVEDGNGISRIYCALYPNPSDGEGGTLRLELPWPVERMRLSIKDALGTEAWALPVAPEQAGTRLFELPPLQPGIWFVRVETERGSIVRKWFVR